METYKISVVLCTYNGENFIKQQIQSILSQSILPDELIIFDDCSEDCTIDIVNNFADRYPSIIKVYCNKKNIGFIKNFEKAIKLSTGDIIFLSDQDDVWFDKKIEIITNKFINHNNTVLIYSDACITDSNLKPTKHTLFERRKNLILDKAGSSSFLTNRVGVKGCTMAFRSCLKEFIFPIESGWGHDHWIVFIAHAVKSVVSINQPLMYYRRHATSAGNDALLEGGHLKAWKVGITTASLDEYLRDLNRWEVMCKRLHEILEKRSSKWVDYSNICVFLDWCERRTEFARQRIRIKKRARFSRLPDVLQLFFSGAYSKYVNGMKSMAKDLFL